MLFNSFAFWTFYLLLFVVYHRLRHRGQNVLLLVGSYFFYGCWDWRFLGLILLSTIIDYSVALGIAASQSPRDADCCWQSRLPPTSASSGSSNTTGSSPVNWSGC